MPHWIASDLTGSDAVPSTAPAPLPFRLRPPPRLAKIERRQSRLRDAIVARDATRQADKLLVPLPSAGLAPFCAALKNPAVCAAAG